MRQRHDLLAFALLVATIAIVAWLAIVGPVVSEVSAKGIYEVAKEWQTLIGVFAAFILGYVAVLPVWKQVKETQRQASSAAIIPLIKTAETLEEERVIVFGTRHAMDAVPRLVDEYDNGNYHEIYQLWPEKALLCINTADNFRQKLQHHIDRHPDNGRNIDGLRRETLKYLKLLHKELRIMSHAFAQQ